MLRSPPPTDQRAGVRPIAFALDDGTRLRTPITLNIRPEDLTRTEPSRTAAHQTLGHGEVKGWVDNFGEGLPTIAISGHTGWRTSAVSGEDGVAAFESLNRVIHKDYHAAKQQAIDTGRDPAAVRLIMIDMLDNFTYSVTPKSFVLRRNKARPLLMQYNIQLQAISTSVDTEFAVVPFQPNTTAGLTSLDGVIGTLTAMADSIEAWVANAVAMVNDTLAPLATTIADFADFALGVYQQVYRAIAAVAGGVSAVANSLISIAADLAIVGVSIFRTLAAIRDLPQSIKHDLTRVASAYNEVLCIFRNSLRPKRVYQSYDDIYGASNCSSTTGGRPASPLADRNVFEMMQSERLPVSLSGQAVSGMAGIGRYDPVLRPIPLDEMNRLVGDINSGSSVNEEVAA